MLGLNSAAAYTHGRPLADRFPSSVWQAENAEIARRQAEELAMRQAAIQEAHRRQAESEELARRQAEDIARRRAALEEQQRALSMLPPAGSPGAGNALLSLLQSSSETNNGLAGLPGMGGYPPQSQGLPSHGQPPPQQQPPQQHQQHQHTGAASDGLAQQQAQQQAAPPAERGRGRGRGVCSAALGTRRSNDPEPGLLGGIGQGLSGLQLQGDDSGYPSADAPALPGFEPEGGELEADGKKGKKGKRVGKKTKEQDEQIFDDPVQPDGFPISGGGGGAWGGAGAAAAPAPAAAAQPQPAWGWSAHASSASTAGVGSRGLTLQQIQEQEEMQRIQRERAAAAAAEQVSSLTGDGVSGAGDGMLGALGWDACC